jgi:hypothetical protein
MAKVQQLTLGLIIVDPDAYRLQQQRRDRKCLSCAGMFRSSGPGNRICAPCKGLEAWSSPADYAIHASF